MGHEQNDNISMILQEKIINFSYFITNEIFDFSFFGYKMRLKMILEWTKILQVWFPKFYVFGGFDSKLIN